MPPSMYQSGLVPVVQDIQKAFDIAEGYEFADFVQLLKLFVNRYGSTFQHRPFFTFVLASVAQNAQLVKTVATQLIASDFSSFDPTGLALIEQHAPGNLDRLRRLHATWNVLLEPFRSDLLFTQPMHGGHNDFGRVCRQKGKCVEYHIFDADFPGMRRAIGMLVFGELVEQYILRARDEVREYVETIVTEVVRRRVTCQRCEVRLRVTFIAAVRERWLAGLGQMLRGKSGSEASQSAA